MADAPAIQVLKAISFERPDYLHYGAPAADYDKGGYEVTECLLAPEWQGIYEETAAKIISKL